MSEPFQTDALTLLRRRLAAHGYRVYLKPDRPTGWWVVLQPRPGEVPTELRAETREEALELAAGLFSRQRVGELDRRLRERGLAPPAWTGTMDQQVERLAAFAAEHGVPT